MSFIIKKYRPIRFRRADGKISHGYITAVNGDGTVNIRSGSGNNILSVPILTNAATGRKFAGVSTPAAPTGLVGTAGDTTASIAFTAASSGGSAITNYEYSTDNGSTFTARSPVSTASPLLISGLTNSTAYQIKLRAVNLLGAGTASSAVTVTPVGASGPAFRSISQGTSTLGTFTMAVPTGTASGDQLLMFVEVEADYKGYTFGAPSAGWTQIAFNDTFRVEYPANTFAVYKRTATASESTYTWSGGANWYGGLGFVMAVSGATAVDVVGATAEGAGGFVAPSVTTTTATDLLIYAAGQAGTDVAVTKPASMTQRANATPTPAYFRMLIATETLTASGATGTRTATGASDRNVSLLIAVK